MVVPYWEGVWENEEVARFVLQVCFISFHGKRGGEFFFFHSFLLRGGCNCEAR